MNKKESKYFATAAKMDKALIELLEKKDFEYITIREICDRAGVNRSTFYLHYENTADLLREASRYVLDGFLSYFPAHGTLLGEKLEKEGTDDLLFIRPEYVMPYLTYIKENQRIFKTVLTQLGTMGFEDHYERMYRHIFDPILQRFRIPDAKRRYVMKFYLTGITAISMEWLKNGCIDPIENICTVIIQCSSGRIYGDEEK